MNERVLIIEDDPLFATLLHEHLCGNGYLCETAKTGTEGLRTLAKLTPDILIVDMHLPDMPGVSVLEHALARLPDLVALVITGHANVETSIEALRIGAEDYLPKPIHLDHLDLTLSRGLERRRLRLEHARLSLGASDETSFCGMVGRSDVMRTVYKEIRRLAGLSSAVLLLGETGVGKELAARAIHASSERAGMPFLAVNCANITDTLLESELFGHVKGAFTGASKDKPGYFEAAAGGTLLLDEIQSASPSVQTSLLRVLDRQEVVPVGGRNPIPVSARVLLTCNRDPEELVASGAFREDLYYRILERSLVIPPLRERREDIPLLAGHFALEVKLPDGVERRKFSPKAMEMLTQCNWPGNVRELRNAVFSIVEHAPRAIIRPSDMGSIDESMAGSPSGFPTLAEVERGHVLDAMRRSHENKAKAAQLLGVSRSTLYSLLQKHEIATEGACLPEE